MSARIDSEPEIVVSMKGPGDVLDAIPHLLGFKPQESIVMVSLVGARLRIGQVLRVDLADPSEAALSDAELASRLAEIATRPMRRVREPLCDVLVVVYTDKGRPSVPERLPYLGVLRAFRDELEVCGVNVRDALVVHRGRWWSAACDNPACCPAEGIPVSRDVPSVTSLTLGVELGAPLESRLELERSVALDEPPGLADEVVDLLAALAPTHHLTRAEQGLEVFQNALADVSDGRALAPAAVALLIALAQESHTRDAFVTAMTPGEVSDATRLWQQLLRLAPPPFDAQVGVILAHLAWEKGQGALARCALERVLASDPDHSLGLLILTGLDNGIAPPPRGDGTDVDDVDWELLPLRQRRIRPPVRFRPRR